MNDEDRDGNIEKKEIQRYDREETNRNRQRKGSQTQMHREQRCKEINTRREAENEKGMGERKRLPEKGEKERLIHREREVQGRQREHHTETK